MGSIATLYTEEISHILYAAYLPEKTALFSNCLECWNATSSLAKRVLKLVIVKKLHSLFKLIKISCSF